VRPQALERAIEHFVLIGEAEAEPAFRQIIV